MPKAILFDLDGVVIDTEKSVWYTSSIELLAKYNKTHDEEKVKHLIMGTAFEEATQILYDTHEVEGIFEEFLEERRELVRKGFAERVEFMKGFDNFFKLLSKRKKAIATAMADEYLSLTLSHLPLQKYFGDHIYKISEVGGHAKPHPDIFLYAAKKLGEDPANCIVIEDAPKGITAGKKAGMRVIALTTSVGREYLQEADYIVDGFDEITDEMLE